MVTIDDNVMRLTKSGDNQRSCNNVMILTTTNMITDYSIIPALFCSEYNKKKKTVLSCDIPICMDTKSMFGDNFKIYIYRQWTDISGSFQYHLYT